MLGNSKYRLQEVDVKLVIDALWRNKNSNKILKNVEK